MDKGARGLLFRFGVYSIPVDWYTDSNVECFAAQQLRILNGFHPPQSIQCMVEVAL